MKLKYSVWSVNSILKWAQWKFLQQSICDFMQINADSALESNQYSWSHTRVSRADSNVREHRTDTSRRTLAAIFNAQTIFSRSTAQSCLSLRLPWNANRETKCHQLAPFQVCCPKIYQCEIHTDPKYTTCWEAKSVLYFLTETLWNFQFRE